METCNVKRCCLNKLTSCFFVCFELAFMSFSVTELQTFTVTEVGRNWFLWNVGIDVSYHMRRVSYGNNLLDWALVREVTSLPCQLYFHYTKCVVSNWLADQQHVFCVHLHRNSISQETNLIRTQQCSCRESETVSHRDGHCTYNVALRSIRELLKR